jgi:hypothetical protein
MSHVPCRVANEFERTRIDTGWDGAKRKAVARATGFAWKNVPSPFALRRINKDNRAETARSRPCANGRP